jgi:Tol biopolymer transport system component/tRNA A-37 threonylcarbamoyl transferase component Bud32
VTDELIGKRVGGYEIIELIGKGGMATVYRAHQLSMNRPVALKILPRQFLNDDTYMQRFEREVQIVSQLEHRGIVPVYDYGETDGQPYIVMRLMTGGALDQMLSSGPLAIDAIARIFDQIAPALDYAHSKGVLHRDLKPSNILMDESGGAFITDFGIARIVGEGKGTITTHGVLGTPAYMSPEQAQGKPLDGRSDVYSLGVLLFEMSTGRRPFDGDTPYGVAVMHVMTPPPTPRSVNGIVSPVLEAVILRALSKSPDARHTTAGALAEQVAHAARAQPAMLDDTVPGQAASATVWSEGVQGYGIPAPAGAASAAGFNGEGSAGHLPGGHPAAGQPAVAHAPVPQMLTPQPLTPQPLQPPIPSARYAPVRRRRGPGLWLSAAIGGGIGCALLVLIMSAAALLILWLTRLEEADGAVSTPLPAETETAALSLADAQSAETGPRTPPAVVIAPTRAPTATLDADVVGGGGRIVFAADRGTTGFDLYLYDVAADRETRLTQSGADEIAPALSPDGTHIVYASNEDGDFELYLRTIDGETVVQLTDNPYTDRAPSWSHDGAWIVFSSAARGDDHDLRRIRPDGTGLETVYSDGMRNIDPRYTRDDSHVLFAGGIPTDPTTWEIWRLDLNGNTPPVALTDNAARDEAPAAMPDGGFVYTTDGDGYAAIARITGGNEQAIVYDSEGFDWGPAVSPDGAAIVFASDLSGRDELYILTLGDGRVYPITNSGGLSAHWGR